MKSSCSARGLSVSQNLPEIALLRPVSLSSDTLSFPSLALFILSHPSTPQLSIHFTLLICIQLSLSPSPLPSVSSADSISASVCFLSCCLPSVSESTQLICNRNHFCHHRFFLMSQFLNYRVILTMHSITFYWCLSSCHFFTTLGSPLSHTHRSVCFTF